MNEIEQFWERLNSLIKKSNTTQNALSVQCGLNPRRLQNLSSGQRLPDCMEAVKIAKSLNTSVEYLVTGELNNTEQKLSEIKNQLLNLAESL